LQGVGNFRFCRELGQPGQSFGVSHHARDNLLPFGRIQVGRNPRGGFVAGQQGVQRRGVGPAGRGEMRLQVGQAAVGHPQLGCGPAGRCPLEQSRGSLNGRTQGIREVPGLAGGHARRGQRAEDQHYADGDCRQSSGPLPDPASGQPT